MARKVIWSYEATADLDALAEYIARDSTFYAASFVQEILTASRSLDRFSERGRIVPEFSNPNIRELFVRDGINSGDTILNRDNALFLKLEIIAQVFVRNAYVVARFIS